MGSNSPTAPRFPSGCCGRRWVRRRPVWRTRASSALSTTTGRSSSTPATRPTADPTSASSFWRQEISGRLPPRRWSAGAAANNGFALFPRRVRGRFADMSRSDRESNSIVYSDHPFVWTDSAPCQRPARVWEALQLGNCGRPIETEAGWLVLTHGVGPMRTYHIGAILLDLEDPTRILGQLQEPPLSPAADEQDGYVPNVVYSCGALVHVETLVLPSGIADSAIGVAPCRCPNSSPLWAAENLDSRPAISAIHRGPTVLTLVLAGRLLKVYPETAPRQHLYRVRRRSRGVTCPIPGNRVQTTTRTTTRVGQPQTRATLQP